MLERERSEERVGGGIALKTGACKSIGHRVIPSASAVAECGWWVGEIIISKSGLVELL